MHTEKQVSRRKFLGLAAAGGAAAALAACATPTPQIIERVVKETVMVAGTPQVVEKVVKETVVVEKVATQVVEKQVEKVVTATPAPKGIVTVQWYEQYPLQSQAPFQTMADNMNKMFAGKFSVKLNHVPQFAGKVLTMVAAGDGPDIWHSNPGYDEPSLGYMQNLTPFIQRDGIDPNKLWYEATWKPRLFYGNFYHVPVDIGGLTLGINKNLFDAAGVKYPTNAWTTDEFVDIALALKPKGKEQKWWPTNLSTAHGYTWKGGGTISNLGFDIISADGHQVKGYLDRPESIAAVQWFIDLQEKHDVTMLGAEEQAFGEAVLLSGRLAIGVIETPEMGAARDAPFKWEMIWSPKYKDNPQHSFVYSSGWFSWSGARNKEEIWEVMKYISGPEGSAIAHKAGAFASACPAVMEESAKTDPNWAWWNEYFKLPKQREWSRTTRYYFKCINPNYGAIGTLYFEEKQRPLERLM
ncbi:MAG: twin-arginine translocation signal domain-containing protein, partial [Anaerolineae bacterium]|nr:twin-arginine translocation signal domain-containing protein [Anaerolineae bacterium]